MAIVVMDGFDMYGDGELPSEPFKPVKCGHDAVILNGVEIYNSKLHSHVTRDGVRHWRDGTVDRGDLGVNVIAPWMKG